MKLKTIQSGSHEITFVNVVGAPVPVAPAWGVHGDRIVIGLYPQMVRTTLDRLAAGGGTGDTILANEDFVWVDTSGELLYFIAADEVPVGEFIRSSVGLG